MDQGRSQGIRREVCRSCREHNLEVPAVIPEAIGTRVVETLPNSTPPEVVSLPPTSVAEWRSRQSRLPPPRGAGDPPKPTTERAIRSLGVSLLLCYELAECNGNILRPMICTFLPYLVFLDATVLEPRA